MSLNWTVTGVFAAAVIAGALAGDRLAGRASPQRLSALFTVLFVGVAAYTPGRTVRASDNIPHRVSWQGTMGRKC